MLFSSLTFLFAFLPITALLYFIPFFRNDARKELQKKNIVLLIMSLIFYAWGEPVYVLLMLISIFFNYNIGIDIEDHFRMRKNPKAVLAFGVVFNLLVLGFFKYAPFVTDNLNSLFGLNVPDTSLALPIGISFYTFQAMSYIIDVYRKKVRCQKNIISFALYITMFPQLIAGPIVQYADIEKQLNNRKSDISSIMAGVLIFLRGLGKKVIFANAVGSIFSDITGAGAENLSTASVWLAMVCYGIQIYFDFSGYSDMAIGLGRIFGFTFPKNFDYPFVATSVTEFWRRWHISLSTWFRDYVYIPLGGNRKGVPRQILNLLIVWGLTGLWHGADWNFIIWGLYYGVLLILEKFVLSKFLDKLPTIVRHILTIIVITIGWAFFSASSIGESAQFLKAMFFAGSGIVDSTALFNLKSSIILLVVTGLSAVGMFRYIPLPEEKHKKLIVRSVGYAVVFIICIISLVSDSYNPFLYFRF